MADPHKLCTGLVVNVINLSMYQTYNLLIGVGGGPCRLTGTLGCGVAVYEIKNE